MKQNLLSALVLLYATYVFGQNTAYFQQQVNYKINVTLDDVTHTLRGDLEIEYTNRSPQVLDGIWMHLWGNAFQGSSTAFAQQKLRQGDTEFYFAKEKDRGYYTGLDFTADGETLTLVPDTIHPDIAFLKLSNPLQPNEKTTVKTPFTLKIPASFSRLGHVGTSYQMTQWYPKTAVFDHKGWHPMPYLDQGEFYSEFGNFDVSITLPENYVVGATGSLQTDSERIFLAKKVAETEALVKSGFPKDVTFPASASTMKTLRYTAENVHDFAWFADKRFHVLHDEAVLSNGKKVDCWAMFTNEEAALWTKGAFYVRRAVEFYSEKIGAYPWPQATAVHSALSAGGGMEYPMITVIGNSNSARALDNVITHEVGHNWFYGILATNEREHSWMDEGMNSYYEYRYMRQYYGKRTDINVPRFLTSGSDMDLYELGYLYQARRRLDQAPETKSDALNSINYGLGAYVKPGTAFGHLEQWLGTERFDAMMKKYFDQWAFKHPYPEDLRQLFEREMEQDLSWFFDGYLGSKLHFDYAISGISKNNISNDFTVTVKNKGGITAPFPISGYKDGKLVKTEWFEPIADVQNVTFKHCDCDVLILDGSHITLDIYRKNNNILTSGILKKTEPPAISFPGFITNDRKTNLGVLPLIGWNKYEGFMLGGVLHNGLVPARRFEYQLAPLYGFDSKNLVGFASLNYHLFPVSTHIKDIIFGLSSKAFNYRNYGPNSKNTLQYRRIVPSFSIKLTRSPVSKFYQNITLRSIFAQQQLLELELDTVLSFVEQWNDASIYELSWEIGNKRVLNPYQFKIALERCIFEFSKFFEEDGKIQYLRLSGEGNIAHLYQSGRKIKARMFAGGFLQNDFSQPNLIPYGAYNLTAQGFNDYRFDALYFGRSESTGFWSQQIENQREGGLKVPLGAGFEEGRSNRFIAALNLQADFPKALLLPLKAYFDMAYCNYGPVHPASFDDDSLWWQGGLALTFWEDAIGIYLPVVSSKNISGDGGLYDQSSRDKFLERIAFSINLNKLSPWKLVDNVQL